MLDTSARLLRLLALLQARRFWPGSELAERLEVTERTVRRDVDRLRSLGYPVDASVGVAGGYQLGASASLPPLLLEDDEALAVAIGLRTAAAGSVAGIEEPTLRAMAKLEQVLPSRLRKRVQTMSHAVASLYVGGPVVDAQVLASLATASRNRESVSFDYADGSGKRSQRKVEPHGLVHTGRRWYLLAWDQGREDWRTFRLDRVQGAVQGGTGFTPREIPGGDAARFVARSISPEAYPLQVRVLFFAAKERVARRVPPGAGRVEAVDDAHCLLSTGARVRDGSDSRELEFLAMHIANIGEDFEVLEPRQLARAVEALGKRLQRAAKRSGKTRARAPASRRKRSRA
ncbi:MAG: YafY family protein [Polyangiaceae bacterium]